MIGNAVFITPIPGRTAGELMVDRSLGLNSIVPRHILCYSHYSRGLSTTVFFLIPRLPLSFPLPYPHTSPSRSFLTPPTIIKGTYSTVNGDPQNLKVSNTSTDSSTSFPTRCFLQLIVAFPVLLASNYLSSMEGSHQYTKPFTTNGLGIPLTDTFSDGPLPRQEEPMVVPNTITGPSMSPRRLEITVNAPPIIMEGAASSVQETEAPKTKPRRSRFAPEPDWSEMRREQIKTKTHRTGQACDRCKVYQESCFPSSCSMPTSQISPAENAN